MYVHYTMYVQYIHKLYFNILESVERSLINFMFLLITLLIVIYLEI